MMGFGKLFGEFLRRKITISVIAAVLIFGFSYATGSLITGVFLSMMRASSMMNFQESTMFLNWISHGLQLCMYISFFLVFIQQEMDWKGNRFSGESASFASILWANVLSSSLLSFLIGASGLAGLIISQTSSPYFSLISFGMFAVFQNPIILINVVLFNFLFLIAISFHMIFWHLVDRKVMIEMGLNKTKTQQVTFYVVTFGLFLITISFLLPKLFNISVLNGVMEPTSLIMIVYVFLIGSTVVTILFGIRMLRSYLNLPLSKEEDHSENRAGNDASN